MTKAVSIIGYVVGSVWLDSSAKLVFAIINIRATDHLYYRHVELEQAGMTS